jgi:pimeloyl-ACP methyl ester carboxylesterase
METGLVPANVEVEGEGPPIVLIHGFGAALDLWDEIAPGAPPVTASFVSI